MKQVVVLGLGPGNPDLLTLEAVQALQSADLVLGAQRLLESLPDMPTVPCIPAVRWQDILRELDRQGDWCTACVVLSGDIGLFSGARQLLAHLDGYRVKTIPGISSMQYFAAKLHRPWQAWRVASAHGVSCDIVAEVLPGGTVFLVTGGQHTVGSLCATLCEAGLGDALVTVGQRLSYPDEAIASGRASDFAGKDFDRLSVMLVEHGAESPWPWVNAGIPDDRFVRGDVPMTKQEVRAAIPAKLQIARDDIVYDIGAGTGSVAVELALLAKAGRVFAVEHNPEAVRLIHKNKQAFGLPNLHVVEGSAPAALGNLPAPNAVFIGGSSGNLAAILETVRRANPLVRVCIACITLETLAEASRLLGGDGYQAFAVCQIAVSRTHTAGRYHMLKAQNPVFLVSARGVCR